MALVVKSFSISKIMEVNRNGEKQSEFLSMKFESDTSLTPEQAVLQQLEAHETVEKSVVFNALASGLITKDTANDRLEQTKTRHAGILAALQDKYGVSDVENVLNAPRQSTEMDDAGK